MPFSFSIIDHEMPWWRNGRRGRLKICCQQWRGGSSPPRGTETTKSSGFVVFFASIIFYYYICIFKYIMLCVKVY